MLMTAAHGSGLPEGLQVQKPDPHEAEETARAAHKRFDQLYGEVEGYATSFELESFEIIPFGYEPNREVQLSFFFESLIQPDNVDDTRSYLLNFFRDLAAKADEVAESIESSTPHEPAKLQPLAESLADDPLTPELRDCIVEQVVFPKLFAVIKDGQVQSVDVKRDNSQTFVDADNRMTGIIPGSYGAPFIVSGDFCPDIVMPDGESGSQGVAVANEPEAPSVACPKWIVAHDGFVLVESPDEVGPCLQYIHQHKLPTSTLFMASQVAEMTRESRGPRDTPQG
jgi:hypothetical protein